MHVIVTAGHVDHGKSTLVRALTGINPDRLREEQQREMTIDLGFAWMTLPDAESVSGDQIGIVDVPGHIDFIDNMLAGVGGIDAALLVIAADEGPMPQTHEHLAILRLLRVPRGVVALTKSDLVDEEWIELVGIEIRQLLATTPLADAAIVPVSARANRGLPALVESLAGVLKDTPPRRDLNRPRLPVDRAFILQGFGAVVTGTLVDGAFAIGDAVEVVTQQGEILEARVRGLQTHKQKLERAQPGSRVAINLSGVTVEQVARGSVVAGPGTLAPTTLVDVQLEMLPNELPRTSDARSHLSKTLLRHNVEVKIFSGASQSIAHAWLLDGDELAPGKSGWAQLQLNTPMALVNGDRFIVRLPSPSITLGGGVVVDAHPSLRYRRRGGRADERVLVRLETLSAGAPTERLENALRELGFATPDEAQAKAQLNAQEMSQATREMEARGSLFVSQGIMGLSDAWQKASASAEELLKSFHRSQPLADGMPRESLRSRLKLPVDVFNALLQAASQLVDDGETVRLASHRVQFDPVQQRAVDALLAQCQAQPWNTPSVKECRAAVGDAVYEAMLRQKLLVQLGPDVVLLPRTYEQAEQRVRELIRRDGQVTAAQVRDDFGTTRKYALALLEHLDAIGFTKRVGDARVLKG